MHKRVHTVCLLRFLKSSKTGKANLWWYNLKECLILVLGQLNEAKLNDFFGIN